MRRKPSGERYLCYLWDESWGWASRILKGKEDSHCGPIYEGQTFCSAFYILWWETVDKSSVWEDKWCGAEPLTTKFPDIYSIIIKKDVSIVDCWVNDQQTWDLGIRRPLFDRVAEW